jgi:hypothetical protein
MAEGTQVIDFATISAALLEESVPALLFAEQTPQHVSQRQHVFWQNPNPFAKPTSDKNSRVRTIERNDLSSAGPSVQRNCDFDTASLNHTSENHLTQLAAKPEWGWSGFSKLWFGFWERRARARHEYLRAKYLRSKKRRESAERAKTVDAIHKHQIRMHREKEKRRNSEARRKAKEQRREVQAKEKRLKLATKYLKDAGEKERKASARTNGITKTRSMVLWIEHKVASVLPKSYDISGKRNI